MQSRHYWQGGSELAGLTSRGMHKEMFQELVRPKVFLLHAGRAAECNNEANEDILGIGSAHSSDEHVM